MNSNLLVNTDSRSSLIDIQSRVNSGVFTVTFACATTDDFFRSRIDPMIDLRHLLAVLARCRLKQEIEAQVAQVFSRKGCASMAMSDLDPFGEQMQRAAVASNAGRPRVPLRIMIALLYLKHAFNESDEGAASRWADAPRWQFLSGCAYHEVRRPCDATTLIKFRQLRDSTRYHAAMWNNLAFGNLVLRRVGNLIY